MTEKNPFRLLPLVAATFPKGTALAAAGKFAAASKGVPLGELFGTFRQVEQNLPLSGEVARRKP